MSILLTGGAGLALGQAPPPQKKPQPTRGVSSLASGKTILLPGQKVNVVPDVPAPPPDVPAASKDTDRDRVFVPYVADPSNKFSSNLPNPPGTASVRSVLNKVRPVSQDRLNFFRPLDRDPLAQQYPLAGWWIYVDKVDPRPDGWIAEVKVTVRFDATQCTGEGIPRVSSYWVERYQYRDGTLTYLGGRSDSPFLPFPKILVYYM